jgi:hypothetical protein
MSEKSAGTAGELVAESGQILSGPDDSIFDDIFDWIANAIRSIIDSVTSYVRSAWSAIQTTVTSWITWSVDTVKSWWQNVLQWVQNAVDWTRSVYSLVSSWISSAYNTVRSAVTSAIGTVQSWISSAWNSAYSWISSHLSSLWSSISGGFSSLWSNVSSRFSQITADISSRLSSFTSSLTSTIGTAVGTITSSIARVMDQISRSFDWFTSWIDTNVVKPLATWWGQFLDRILDFPAWISKLFDAMEAWLTVDVPGHSPRWTAIFDGIGHWFGKWFYDFPKWFFGDFPENVAYGLSESWSWFTRGLQPVVEAFMDALVNYTSKLGPFAPSMGAQHYSSLLSVGATAVFGLVGMTLAGELLHPLKNLGLGNIAAMVFDLTNYKMLTGAFVTALATAAIALPMRYYYQDIFRPWLPDARTAGEMHSRQYIDNEKYHRLLGYYGIPDEWHEYYYQLTETKVGYFALANVAKNGVFDHDIFERDLHRAGYAEETIELLLDMYQKSAQESVRVIQTSTALGRFTLGFTSEDQLAQELRIVGASEQMIPFYVVNAKLEFSTQYTKDLVYAYRDAVRAGNITIEEYRDQLLGLGVQPSKVAAYVFAEQARIKPSAKLTQIGAPKQIYLTDSGKLQLETIRLRRRKNTITRAEELNALLALGVDSEYAGSIADNDDARLLEAESIEPTEAVPIYKTDAGKVSLATVRTKRRKNDIDREGELSELAALGVPEYLAKAYADNDDVALVEKVPTAAAPEVPEYETDAGKIKVDTIRRARRKAAITREDELAQLAELGMPDWLVQAVVENDDIRMTGKAEAE